MLKVLAYKLINGYQRDIDAIFLFQVLVLALKMPVQSCPLLLRHLYHSKINSIFKMRTLVLFNP